uniref:Uncharacterized protein n=1 Tax=Biomphalaria glabrata TaxID=6526 RepID=A0A2C9M4W9_BIOGL
MVDKCLLESSKSFQKCLLANTLRRNSLIRKTNAIEIERKLVCNMMDREKRLFKEHVKNMQIEQARTCACKTAKERTLCSAAATRGLATSGVVDSIDPYPVTFPRKGAPKKSQHQRCASIEGKKHFNIGCENGNRGIKTPNKSCYGNANEVSFQSHHGLVSSSWTLTRAQETAEDNLWVGDPEAIHSVRRARKSVAQQDMERLRRMREHLNI